MTARFVVTEIEGYQITLPVRIMGGGKINLGLSVQVVDTAWNHRVVFSARTEEAGSRRYTSHDQARAKIRERARARCAALNAAHEEEVAA